MILSAGLTPAWQQIMVFESFHPGEVNRAAEVHWLAQGKVLNVGIAAHHLGGQSLTLATMGGPPMTQIDREFNAMGVPHRWVITESSTRVCTTVLDRATNTITELVENGRPLRAEELHEFLRVYAEEAAGASVAIISGSLPVGVPSSFYREILSRTPCPAILDFRGEGLWNVLDLNPLIVKPNRDELSKTVGWTITDDDELFDAMRSLNLRGAQWVAVTHGPGPVWLTSAKKRFKFHPPLVDSVVNPIGSGDSMAAGIAWAIRAGRDIIDAVKFGVAAGSENVRNIAVGRLDHVRVEHSAVQVRVDDLS